MTGENHSKILIKKAKIIDPNSPFHNQQKDILISEDLVQKIGDDLDEKDCKIIEHPNLHISAGWFDLRANFSDPGREEREDIESGIRAAIAGGFTGVALSPETEPPLDSKADIEYVYQKASGFPVNLFPYGSISKELKGLEISEMYDMWQAGAVGFSHGKKPIENAALMRLALLYSKNFAPPLHVLSLENSLGNGQMHEGETSTFLGLKGIPALAEEVGLLRDLRLAEYTESALHFMNISSAQGVDILKDAHQKGQAFTADVAIAKLIFTDAELDGYDTRFKVLPPLRSESDRKSLLNAICEEVIQVITSDHSPVDVEGKKCEFDQAEFGMIGLQTLFGSLGNLDEELDLETIIKCIAQNPRKILNLEVPKIEEGSWAEFTLFDPEKEWTFTKEMNESRSDNSPFFGRKMRGKSLGIINNGILVWMPH